MIEPIDQVRILEVFPYLRVRNAVRAIDFYEQAFGAVEEFRLQEPGGRIGHAQLRFGPAIIMLSDEYPECDIHSPMTFGGTGCSIHLHVENVDDVCKRAVEAGAKLLMCCKNQFYGERTAKVLDPFGHEWLLGQQVENVSGEEMKRRFEEMF